MRFRERIELQISAQNPRAIEGVLVDVLPPAARVRWRSLGRAEGKLPPRKGGAVRPHPHRGGGHKDPAQPAHAAQRQRRGEAESPTKH